jgi:hypothetical protein
MIISNDFVAMVEDTTFHTCGNLPVHAGIESVSDSVAEQCLSLQQSHFKQQMQL